MKASKWVLGAIAALAGIAALVAACGGSDNGNDASANIKTDKGLAVAALVSNLSAGQSSRDAASLSASSSNTAAGAQAAAPAVNSVGTGKNGVNFAPPQVADGGAGITVQGYGSATAKADSAIIEFYFSRNGGIVPVPLPEGVPPTTDSSGANGGGGSSSSSGVIVTPGKPIAPGEPYPTQGQVDPITEADLQPVIDAIVGAGVSRSDIEFVGQGYADPYYASASLRVTAGDPEKVSAIVDAANAAAANLGNIYSNGSNVSYTVSDCAALELAAMQAAVDDANERGDAFAKVLKVGKGSVTAASQYSYSEFGGTACGGFGGVPMPYPTRGGPNGGSPSAEVQVYASVSITFAIK